MGDIIGGDRIGAKPEKPVEMKTNSSSLGILGSSGYEPTAHEVFYDTNDDSPGSKMYRSMLCGCCDDKVHITTEQVILTKWEGICGCTKKEYPFDIDNIEDLQLVEHCGVGMCIFGKGTIKIFGSDGDQGNDGQNYFNCRGIENAATVFLKMSEWVHKTTDLKNGMKRPDDPNIPYVMYCSRDDSSCIKNTRTFLCCGCTRPTSIITKSGVTTAKWGCCRLVTKRIDVDNIKDVQKNVKLYQSCCGAGDIRIYGQDADQRDESFDITWIDNVSEVFQNFNNFHKKLDNRERVGF